MNAHAPNFLRASRAAADADWARMNAEQRDRVRRWFTALGRPMACAHPNCPPHACHEVPEA